VTTQSTGILRRDMADGPGARRSRERVVSPLRPVTYPAGTRSRARRTPPEVACTRSGGPTFYRLPQGFDRINEGLGRLPIDHVPGSFDPDHRGTLDLVTSTSVAAFASRCHYPASRSTRSRGCAMACLDGADNLLLGAATLHDAFFGRPRLSTINVGLRTIRAASGTRRCTPAHSGPTQYEIMSEDYLTLNDSAPYTRRRLGQA